jgi:hypothetical protein
MSSLPACPGLASATMHFLPHQCGRYLHQGMCQAASTCRSCNGLSNPTHHMSDVHLCHYRHGPGSHLPGSDHEVAPEGCGHMNRRS